MKPFIFAAGDSITNRVGASDPSKAYISLFGEKLGMPVVNKGLNGSGAFEASKQAFIAAGRFQRTNGLWTCMAGFGDLNNGGLNGGKTITKIQGCHRSFLTAAFMGEAVAISSPSVTKSGTWTDIPSAMFCRSEMGLGGKGKYTSVAGAELHLNFCGDSFFVDCYNSDGAVEHVGRVRIVIDGVIAEDYNGESKADGVNNGLDAERLTHETRLFPCLGPGPHTAVIASLDNLPTYIGAVGTLNQPDKCQPVLIAEPPYMTSGTFASNRGNAEIAGRAIQEVVCQFYGYPVRIVRVNDFYRVEYGIGSDGIHPNDYGHAQIAQAFDAAVQT